MEPSPDVPVAAVTSEEREEEDDDNANMKTRRVELGETQILYLPSMNGDGVLVKRVKEDENLEDNTTLRKWDERRRKKEEEEGRRGRRKEERRKKTRTIFNSVIT
jgi:hypothetical protein